jgi:potassium-transporting ATPase KdpC subunit
MRELKAAAIAVVAFTLVLGLAYPLVVTGISQVVFPERADGEGRLLGREYPDDLFQARPSVTGYAADATFFNNQGPNQRELADQLKGYVDDYIEREGPYTPGLSAADIPSDAATTSASGVDPDISDENARIQANRVAERRGLDRARVLELVEQHAGRGSVNVYDLNAAVERSR